MVKPIPGGKRARTRAALIDAARQIIAERGFEAVSLNEVASRVGVTTGSIYSNFRGKGDLLWAVAREKAVYMQPKFKAGASLKTQARAYARALMALLPQSKREAAFHRALDAYAQIDPELDALRAAEQGALIDAIAGHLESEHGPRLIVPARTLSVAIQALTRGFIAQWHRTPGEVTEDIVARAFEIMLLGAVR